MSAKLHLAISKNKLFVRNVTSGEVSLYYLVGKEVKHMTLNPNCAWVNLLLFTDAKGWLGYPSLQNMVNSGAVQVADVD